MSDGPCGYVLRRIRREGEPEAEWERKQLLVPVVLCCTFIVGYFAVKRAALAVAWAREDAA
eukprot:gene51983-46964_t